MATGPDMLDAVLKRAREAPPHGEVKINFDDRDDLRKVTADDLTARGIDPSAVGPIVEELRSKTRVDQLAAALGVRITVVERTLNLISGEGCRRAAELLKDDPRTLEEIFRELDEMRHPENYRS